MKRLLILLPSFICILVGCAASTGTPDDAFEIEEAVVRYQLLHNSSSQRELANVYCIERTVGNTSGDPDGRLIERFRNQKRPVRNRSACVINNESIVIDRVSGAQGLIIKFGTVVWKSSTEATIEGGYYEANESSSGSIFHLKKINGSWIVTEDKMKWIS